LDTLTLIAVASIITAGFTIALGSIGPAIGEGRAVSTALSSLAQQPDASATITRTLFVGLAMIESTANPYFCQSLLESRDEPAGGKVRPCPSTGLPSLPRL